MKTRRLLALVLAIAMIATIFVVPTAAVEPGAACEILGLLKGDGDGVTAEYLALATTRAQGLLITLRARGLENAALAYTGTGNFDDITDVNAAFWGPILGYAFANPELGWIGDGDGNFRPAAVMSGAELAKVMLAVLGYEQGVDFEWADIATFAASKGVTVAEGTVTNDDLAASLVEALALENSDGVVLVDAMIADGIVSEADAVAAGVVDATVPAAFEVEVTGVKKIVATFATAQNTDTAIIALKKGAVGQAATVAWNTAKTELTLTKTTPLTKGDYTLTVNGEAIEFNVQADETATELVIKNATIYAKTGPQDIGLNLLNQYGEKMTFTASQMVGGASYGTFALTADSATLSVPAEKDKTSTIFAYYSPKNFTLNATVTVVADQVLSSIAFTGPITQAKASKDYGRLTEGTAGNTLALKALDQYGNVLDLSKCVTGGLTPDYTLVISGATATAAKDHLALSDLTKGTFTVRAIANKSGNVSDLYTETVYALPALASFDITVPDGIYANEKAAFVIVGTDQYGKPIDVADPSTWTVNPLSTAVSIATSTDRENAKNKVSIKFTGKGAAELYFITGALTVSKTINVQAEKVATTIASIPLTTQAILQGKKVELDPAGVKMNDQYGNPIGLPAGYKADLRRLADKNPLTGWEGLATDTDNTPLVLSVGSTATSYFIRASEQKVGSDNLQLTIYTGDAGLGYGSTATTYKAITYDFLLSSVAASSIETYEFIIKDEMYAGATSATTGGSHDLAIALIGKTANGTTVTLEDSNLKSLPFATIAQYTVSGGLAVIDSANSKLTVATATTATADSTTTIKAWSKTGVEVATKVVTLRKAAPAVTTLALTFKAGAGSVVLAAKDQYGIAITPPAGNYYSSNAAAISVDGSGNVTLIKATPQTVDIRFVSTDGVWTREVSVTK